MSDAKPSSPVIPTPHVLHFFLFLAAVAALIFYLISSGVVKSATDAAKTFDKDAVPSIVAAQEIRKLLAEADSCAVKVLLDKNAAAPRSAAEQYDSDVAALCDRLVAASQNITYGDEERVPILKMTQALPRYAAEVALSRSADPAANTTHIRAAVKIAQTEIMPQADALDDANFRHLHDEYETDKSATTTKCAEVIFAGLLLLGILAGTQFSLLSRFHRILNLPLVGATVLLMVMGVWLVYALCAAQGWLKVAKEDAFSTMHTLWKIRAAEYDADTDVALWLLDSNSAGEYDAAFKRKANRLSTVSITDSFIAHLEHEQNGAFDGLLGDALRKNEFFPGEHSATVWMLRSHKFYLDLDGQIRDLERTGKHTEAVALWAGERDGESTWALERFDKQLANSLSINQVRFTDAVAQANDQFGAFGLLLPSSMLMIVFLAWLGLRPRIREYA